MPLSTYPFFLPFFLLQCLSVLTNLSSFTCCCLHSPFLPHIIGLFHCPSPQVSFTSSIYCLIPPYLPFLGCYSEDHSRSQEEPRAQEESYPHFHIHKSPWSKEKAVTLRIYSVLIVLKLGSTKCKWHLQNSTKLPGSVHPLHKSPISW